MSKLEEFLKQAKADYYRGEPSISDEVYDRLEEQVGATAVGTDEGTRIPHMFPMYSLQKVYEGEKDPHSVLKQWAEVTPKLDGAAISLQYIDGELSMALTRGDGKKGLDITDKVRHLVPTRIFWTEPKQITGEIVTTKDRPNARNYAAGALNLKSVEEVMDRQLYFVAYGIQPCVKPTWKEDMYALEPMCDTAYATYLDTFPQDGEVWRVNDNKAFEELGYTSHHPRGAFALKEKKEGVVTKLLDVKWQVGKSGAVSPVAILEPCIIGEAKVSRATLHNMAIIEALDLEIGCMVEVIRAGEIIPQIVARVD